MIKLHELYLSDDVEPQYPVRQCQLSSASTSIVLTCLPCIDLLRHAPQHVKSGPRKHSPTGRASRELLFSSSGKLRPPSQLLVQSLFTASRVSGLCSVFLVVAMSSSSAVMRLSRPVSAAARRPLVARHALFQVRQIHHLLWLY